MKRRNRLSSKAAAAIAVAVGIRAGSHSPAAPVSEALGAGHEPVPAAHPPTQRWGASRLPSSWPPGGLSASPPAPSAHLASQWLQMASSALSIAQPSTSCMIALKKSFMPVHMRRLELFPIHGMDMGVASDVNVYTFARFAVRIGLPGRPVPHGRRSLQTARAACATTVFHLCDRGVTLVSTLLWRCCFGDLRAAARA